MATTVSFNGTSFVVPSIGEEDWGGPTKVDGLLVSLANNALSRGTGSFPLTTELDLGNSKGIKVLSIKSQGTNTSTSGVIRLANDEAIGWRNAANNNSLELKVSASDQLMFNNKPLMSSAGYVYADSGGTGLTSYVVGDMLYADSTSSLAALGISQQHKVLVSTGTLPSWSLLSDSNISASAAIARTKIAVGSGDHVLINDNAGNLSSEAQLSVGRGGTGAATLTGYVKGNGTSAFTASATIPRADLASGSANHVLINTVAGAISSEAQLAKSRGGCGADMTNVTFPSTGTIATIAGSQTLSNKAIQKRVVALVDAATISLDASLGDVYRVTLAGNRTLANPTNLLDGQMIAVHVKQDAVGGRTLLYGNMFRFSTDLPQPTLSITANMTDRLLFEYDGSAGKLDLVAVNKGYL